MATTKYAGPSWGAAQNDPVLHRLQPPGTPLLFEDEGLEMGESIIHSLTCGILFYGIRLHFARRRNMRVFANLNLYYSDDNPTLYVSPDLMIVQSLKRFADNLASYAVGKSGPAPRLVGEVLSFRTWQEGDMTSKPLVYAGMEVREYVLVDVTGVMLPQRLVLLRRQADGTWLDEQDPDGGLTSQLGFRLIVEKDGHLRVCDAGTGKRYPRPDEAGLRLQEAEAAYKKEHELRKRLEAELARLRQGITKAKQPGNGNKGRQKP
jgi:Uma2 family endonuclease